MTKKQFITYWQSGDTSSILYELWKERSPVHMDKDHAVATLVNIGSRYFSTFPQDIVNKTIEYYIKKLNVTLYKDKNGTLIRFW